MLSSAHSAVIRWQAALAHRSFALHARRRHVCRIAARWPCPPLPPRLRPPSSTRTRPFFPSPYSTCSQSICWSCLRSQSPSVSSPACAHPLSGSPCPQRCAPAGPAFSSLARMYLHSSSLPLLLVGSWVVCADASSLWFRQPSRVHFLLVQTLLQISTSKSKQNRMHTYSTFWREQVIKHCLHYYTRPQHAMSPCLQLVSLSPDVDGTTGQGSFA
ncbi:uncharacterized protein C8Q71DRAFT_539964 [Rhodofomes roseus]|uniref:Uncharacterized protein n=1 Tax=Rhodofomes roseus TaxID=34475 RepID=A0ABQ8KKG6_9APHY|nr:uncharacterized protein C8Q71DRAFT_539964 [Rhodofomes roseus]KAH9838639.1 hypothetical protein C8Q71DRAFT_539964 [Rhodofomes roseus]